MTATVRIRPEDMKALKKIAKQDGISVIDALALAVAELRKKREFDEEVARLNANADYFNKEMEDVLEYAAPW